MTNGIKLFLVLLLCFSDAMAIINIIDKSPFSSEVSVNTGWHYGTYTLTAYPGQTIYFQNTFPYCITQQTNSDYCQSEYVIPGSAECVIKLDLIAPSITGNINAIIRACLKDRSLCTEHQVNILITQSPTQQPAVLSIYPAGGVPVGGTDVNIIGNGFIGNHIRIHFGTILVPDADITIVNESKLVAKSPAVTDFPVAVNITVTTPLGGTSNPSKADEFIYNIVPNVSSLQPDHGSSHGNTTITITGRGFFGATNVKFGTKNAKNFSVNSDERIIATSPAHDSVYLTNEDVRVTVTNPSGNSNDNITFTYILDRPIVTGVYPDCQGC